MRETDRETNRDVECLRVSERLWARRKQVFKRRNFRNTIKIRNKRKKKYDENGRDYEI